GIAVIITPVLVDYVIRRMGGLKGLLGCLGWCFGFALTLSGAMGFVTSIFVALFMLASTASLVGENPYFQLASLVVTAFCALLGGGLMWLLRKWRPSVRTGEPSEEIVVQSRAEVTRWGRQWLLGFAITFFILPILSFTTTMPSWLAKNDYGPGWPDVLAS